MCDKQQASTTVLPLADILLSQDQLSPTTTPPPSASIRQTSRMHIHIDMSNSPYLAPGSHHSTEGIHLDTSLRGRTCSNSPPAIVAYTQESTTPYSAVSQASRVSSFNYPAVADPTLLTPVSNCGSPSLQERETKTMHSYVPSSGAQQLTPPTSSRTAFYSYDANVSSQSSSPMTIQPQCTEGFEINTYINASPKDEIPPQMSPYFGSYGVSEAADPECVPQMGHEQFHPYGPPIEGGFLSLHPRELNPLMPGHAPILNQPHPGQFRYRGPTIEDLRDPTMIHLPPHQMQPCAPHMPSPGPRKSRPNRGKRTTSRRAPRQSSAALAQEQPQPKPVQGTGTQGQDNNAPRLELSDKATPEEKYLLELKSRYIDEKGKGMWASIRDQYNKKFAGEYDFANLQMKLMRAVLKHGVWPESEQTILERAYIQARQEMYPRIIAIMKENGGCRIHDWKKQHVEAQLVKMGLEEPEIDETTKLRRRTRNAQRRRSAAAAQQQETMVSWSSMNLPHPQYPLPQAPVCRKPSYETMSDTVSMCPQYTSDQENELYEQIERKYGFQEDDAMVDCDVKMEAEIPEGDLQQPESNLNHVQSERVARQACEQLMRLPMKATMGDM